jgi:SprT protein
VTALLSASKPPRSTPKNISIEKMFPLPRSIEPHFPENAYAAVTELFRGQAVEIKIVKCRTTKFADFNPPDKQNKYPLITINNNLNPFLFLITLLHEFAHFLVWKDGHLYAKPHGKMWKDHFRRLMNTMIEKNIFPCPLVPYIAEHIEDPRATSCTDTRLYRKLSSFDKDTAGVFIEDIPDGSFFQTPDGSVYRRENKVRKRILCSSIHQKKKYLFSPIYKVFPLKGQQFMIVFP